MRREGGGRRSEGFHTRRGRESALLKGSQAERERVGVLKGFAMRLERMCQRSEGFRIGEGEKVGVRDNSEHGNVEVCQNAVARELRFPLHEALVQEVVLTWIYPSLRVLAWSGKLNLGDPGTLNSVNR